MSQNTRAEADQTITRYEGFLARDPDNPQLLTALGDLYHRCGRFDEALRCYDRCLALAPGHGAARSRKAGVLISQHRFVEAERALRALLDEAEQVPALLHNLGLTLYYQKRWKEALEAFATARQRGLDDAENLAYQTYALHHLGAIEQALAVGQEWLAKSQGSAAAGYLALLQMDGGDIEAAVRRAEDVLANAPEDTNAELVVGMWATENQNTDDALARFERITAREPGNPRAWLGLALVHLQSQNHPKAIAAFEEALRFMPDNVGTIVALGWAHFTARDLPGAERAFRRAIEVDRTFGEAHGGLAAALVLQNRREEAHREIAVARRLDANGFGLVYASAVLLALEGRRALGEHLVAKALERRVRPGGPTLIESIQVFVKKVNAGTVEDGTAKKPPPPPLQ